MAQGKNNLYRQNSIVTDHLLLQKKKQKKES